MRLWTAAATRSLPRAGIALAAVLVLAGCATRSPEPPPFPESLLLTDYSSWFAVDVAGNRDLIELVLADFQDDLGGVVSRTDRIVGGLRVLPGAPADFSAVAAGDFPRGGVQFALRSNRTFERLSTDVDGNRATYFRQLERPLQLAIPAPNLMYISTGRVLEMLQPRRPAELDLRPDVYRQLRRVGTADGADALVIFDDPGRGVLQSLGVDAGPLPLTRISLSVTNVDDAALELGGSFAMRSARDAALFGRVGRLFVIVFVRSLGLDSNAAQANAAIEVEGASVVFSGIPMQRDELTAALSRISGAE